jgi:hypothetical protein
MNTLLKSMRLANGFETALQSGADERLMRLDGRQ